MSASAAAGHGEKTIHLRLAAVEVFNLSVAHQYIYGVRGLVTMVTVTCLTLILQGNLTYKVKVGILKLAVN